ncbi:MAG: glycine--tRNA ligase subunit beta [Pseudomonadota bacterium]
MADFLLEFLSEEIPARMQARAASDLDRLIRDHLTNAGLTFDAIETHVTPRRLVAHVTGLPTASPDTVEERKGPRIDAPEKAIEGFLKASGLTLEECEQRDTPKGKVWFAVRSVPGRPTAEILVEAISTILAKLAWPKSMRWQDSGFRWVRPLHHIMALFDGAPLAGEVEPDPKRRYVFSALTHGHRFMAPEALEVASFADYRDKLRAAKVILDREERKSIIREQVNALAGELGLIPRDDPGLVEEVAGLVEYPVVYTARIDEAFMSVPDEALITAMRSHQKYFALLTDGGKLAPRFVLVANTETSDGGAAVIAGNERVLRARLSDAKFFWDQDRQQSLGSRVPKLEQITFHEKLGTMDAKVDRIESLAVTIGHAIPGADIDRVRSAARLAKADLVTGMVGEFPELQGIMGRYYALEDGEHADVANAVAEHYAPLGPSDKCPTAPVSVAVALADKIDTLVGFWSIDEKPTGSRDPYALRRAALGVIRLILENKLRISMQSVFEAALANYPDAEPGSVDSLPYFIGDRLKVSLRDQGVRHDLIQAVVSVSSDDLVSLLNRVDALGDFLETDDGANLLVAYRRAANIERIEAKKDKVDSFGAIDETVYELEEERALSVALTSAEQSIRPMLESESFIETMAELAKLRAPVDRFFDEVTVNSKNRELRRNRLALLSEITSTVDQVADFSVIEG